MGNIEKYLTMEEANYKYGVSKKYIHKLIEDGLIEGENYRTSGLTALVEEENLKKAIKEKQKRETKGKELAFKELQNIYTVSEVAEMLGITGSSVRRQVQNGKFEGCYRKTEDGTLLIHEIYFEERRNNM